MSKVSTTNNERQRDGDSLALWLVSAAASLDVASTRDEVLTGFRAALNDIGVTVAAVWSNPDGTPWVPDDSRILRAGEGRSALHAAVGAPEGPQPDEHQAAAQALLGIAAKILDGLPSDGPLVEPSQKSVVVDDLARSFTGNPDTHASIALLLDVVNRQCSPSFVAILREDPLTLVQSAGDIALENPPAAAEMCQLAATMFESVPPQSIHTAHLASSGPVEAVAVRLSSVRTSNLTLFACNQIADQTVPRLDLETFTAIGHWARTSGRFDASVNTSADNSSYLDALNDATLAAASAQDIRQIYDTVRDVLARVMPLDVSLIAIVPEGQTDAVTVYRSEGATSYYNPVELSQPFQNTMKLGRPFIVDDIPEDLNRDGRYRFGDKTRQVRSLAGAPLEADGQVKGLLVVQSYEPAAYRVEHADLLMDIGRSIAVALERATLVDRLKAHSIRESTLRSLTEKIAGTLNIPSVLDQVVTDMSGILEETLVLAVHIDNVVIPERKLVAVAGPDDLRRELGISATGDIVPGGIADRVLAVPQPVQEVRDGRALVSLPLRDDATCIGNLLFARNSTLPFSDDERSAFAILEGIVTSALRNALLYRARARDESDLLEVERISRLVASSLETENVLKEILASLPALFQAEGCSVRIVEGNYLVPLAVHGDIVHSFNDRIPIATSLAGSIVRQKTLLAVDDLHSHPMTGRHSRRTGVKVRGWLAAPMIDAEGEVFGILSLHSDYPRHWTERDKALLHTMAESTTVAIQNAWRFSRTRDTLLATVESLANAVDAKDPTTLNHARNVSAYARLLAEAMSLPLHEVESIALAGLLHDIGKIGIPDRILQKPDILSADEWNRMKTHPVIGEQILSGNQHLQPVLPMVRHHHERWDGMGYPDQLRGDEIPVGAAIVALADAIDTMSSERPYRNAIPWNNVAEIVQSERGRQFHPEVVDAFMAMFEQEAIPILIEHPRGGPRFGDNDQPHIHSMSLDARAMMIFHGVAREIRALTDLDTFIANVSVVIRSVMEMSDIQIFLVDEGSNDIYYEPNESDRLRGFRPLRRPMGAGVVGWVVEHGEPLLVPDVSQDERFIPTQVSDVRSELAVPLIVDDRVIGAINAESSMVAAFSDADVRLLTATAAHLAQTIQVARLHNQFKQLATTDSLTGLANHRAFYDRLAEELRHAEQTGGIITIAIMDVDNLKAVNDAHGHLAGDTMLREIASVLKERCRRSDYIARYGGDEFAFILADTDLAGANRAISHMVEGLRERSIVIDGQRVALSTGAWGLSTYPEDGARPSELVRVADHRMYANKLFSRSSTPAYDRRLSPGNGTLTG